MQSPQKRENWGENTSRLPSSVRNTTKMDGTPQNKFNKPLLAILLNLDQKLLDKFDSHKVWVHKTYCNQFQKV
jgi:hypothetical protein